MLVLSDPATPISHPDYYAILNLSSDASQYAIHEAYRKLAPIFHPDCSTADSNRFRHLAEAYTVLSDARLRAIYSTYGYIGLHKGVESPCFSFAGWSFTLDPLCVYSDFFGTQQLLLHSDFSLATPGAVHRSPDLVLTLALTLEQWFSRDVHLVSFVRDTLSKGDLRTVVQESGQLRIDLKTVSNTLVGCKLVYAGQGHWIHPLSVQGDLVVLVKVENHAKFTTVQNSSDLHTQYIVTLKEALGGFNAQLTGVDGAALVVPVWDVVQSGSVKTVQGQGLWREGGGRGDLILKFLVQFPEVLYQDQVEVVKHHK